MKKRGGVNLNRVQLLLPEWKSKIVTLSYDDEKVTDRKLVQIFNKFSLKGTFHLSSAKLDQREADGGYITKNEVLSLYKGHEVACHTKNHSTLTLFPKEQMIQEILENRRTLEELVNYPVRGFSYPMGVYDKGVKEVLLVCGIQYARTTQTTARFDLPQGYFAWGGTCHHNDHLLSKTAEFLARERPNTLNMLYIWGHSYEFENDHNWDVIEQFGQSIVNSSEVWCATNIQIVDYLTAFQQLQFAVESSFIYNPTDTDIYLFVHNSKRYIIARKGKTTFISE